MLKNSRLYQKRLMRMVCLFMETSWPCIICAASCSAGCAVRLAILNRAFCSRAPLLTLPLNIDFMRLAVLHVSTFRLSPRDKLKFGDSELWFLSSSVQCRMAPFLTLLLNIDFVRLAALHASTFRLSPRDKLKFGDSEPCS